jgi:hypothetical protein
VIDSYVARDRDLRAYELSPEDWTAIRLVTRWLKAFRSATTQMSATKYTTLKLYFKAYRSQSKNLFVSFLPTAGVA